MEQQLLHINGPENYNGEITIELPGSKSIINRQLMMASLQEIQIGIDELQFEADDTILMHKNLNLINEGRAHRKPIELNCSNAGTVARMAGIYAGFKGGHYLLTGDTRLRERPMEELVSILLQAGVKVRFLNADGHLPFEIESTGFQKNNLFIEAKKSSQQLSAMLIVAPFIRNGATFTIAENSVSQPYVDMTIKMMRSAGAVVEISGNTIRVAEGSYSDFAFTRERDWSSAAFFYQAAALLPKPASLLLKNLNASGLQGDEAAMTLFARLGVRSEAGIDGIRIDNGGDVGRSVQYDFTHHPDLFNSYAVTAALMGVQADLTGIENLRFKESDRLSILLQGLEKIGSGFTYRDNHLKILPTEISVDKPLQFDSAADHRIAMSFAMAGLQHEVYLSNPLVVSKSFPGFYAQLMKIAKIRFMPDICPQYTNS